MPRTANILVWYIHYSDDADKYNYIAIIILHVQYRYVGSCNKTCMNNKDKNIITVKEEGNTPDDITYYTPTEGLSVILIINNMPLLLQL